MPYQLITPDTSIIVEPFQTLWLSHHGLQATTDLNHDKPMCLEAAELRADSMGMESCSLYGFRGQLKSDESDLKRGDVSHKEANIRFSSLKEQKQFPDFRLRPTKSKQPPQSFS